MIKKYITRQHYVYRIRPYFGNLLEIKDNFTKIVVSMDEMTGAKFKGIRHVNIRDFLVSVF